MTRTAHSEDRSTPVFRECDGAPWPSDDELERKPNGQLSARAATSNGGSTMTSRPRAPCLFFCAGRTAARAEPADPVVGDGAWEWDDITDLLGGEAASVADLDARLGHLECVVTDRQRATADEYRLILAILDDAAFDPTPWVGPDPTLDRAWHDARGRTPGAVRRDRIDLAERAAVAEIAVRLHLSEQTVRTRAAHARTLSDGCPQLWKAFAEGRLSEKHAVDAARLASTLPAGDADAFHRFDDEACPQALALPRRSSPSPPAPFASVSTPSRSRRATAGPHTTAACGCEPSSTAWRRCTRSCPPTALAP